MSMRSRNSEKASLPVLGMMLAVSLVLSYVETLIPMPFAVPGMKLGLSNLIVVLLLNRYGAKEALTVNLLRITLSAFLFGAAYALLFSFAGALCSFTGMVLLRKSGRFGIPGISTAGGMLHNAGQLLVAAWTVQTYGVLFFAPPLLLTGVLTGLLIGLIAQKILSLI